MPMSAPAGGPRPEAAARRLDRKLGHIAAGHYTPDDFVIADAKDADMAFGLACAGPVTGGPGLAPDPRRIPRRDARPDRPG